LRAFHFGLVLAVLAANPGAAQANALTDDTAVQQPAPAAAPVVVRVVPSGEERNINFFAAIDPGCESMGPIVVRTVSDPGHGTIRAEAGTSYPVYATTNPRAACNDKTVPGLKLFYTSKPGWIGEDSFRLLVIYPNGDAEDIIFNVISR